MLTSGFLYFHSRSRPSNKVAKKKSSTNVTSVRKPEVPLTTSSSTSTKTTLSAPASAGVTITATPPPVPESTLTTRVESPLAAKSQPETKTQYAMTSMSKAPPSKAAKGPLIQPSKLKIDYSRLQIGGNKSFMEACEEATKANEEIAKFTNEELSSLGALKMIHSVSFSF